MTRLISATCYYLRLTTFHSARKSANGPIKDLYVFMPFVVCLIRLKESDSV